VFEQRNNHGASVASSDEYENEQRMQTEAPPTSPPRVVHLELHTRGREAASAFYAELLGWRTERIGSRWGDYHALLLGGGLDGGVVECGTRTAGWLPYVAVDRIGATTERARNLGASVLLGPREGPAGWRAVVWTPAGGEIALWQQKR
jgi:predicted enzyme related to lactoylglutathione lyase